MATAQNPFAANAAPKPTATGPAPLNVRKEATTAGQLESLLAGDSPYIAQARTRAAQQANARGLINSTMGVQAGESAAINAAMPIAQSDAGTFFSADRFNAENTNVFNRDENMFNREDYMAGQQRGFQAGESALDRQFRSGESAADRAQQLTLQQNELGFNREQSELDRVQQKFLQGQQLSFEEQQLLRQQGFNREQSELERQQQRVLQGNELGFNREQLSQAAREAQLDRIQQKEIQGQQLSFEERQLLNQQKFAESQSALDRQQQTSLQQSEQAFRGQQSAFDRELQVNLQQIDAVTRQNLAGIEADYKTLLQTSANSQELFRETTKNIAAIQLNEKLDAAAKKVLVEEQEAMLRNAMALQGALSNLNLGSLVNF